MDLTERYNRVENAVSAIVRDLSYRKELTHMDEEEKQEMMHTWCELIYQNVY